MCKLDFNKFCKAFTRYRYVQNVYMTKTCTQNIARALPSQ